MSILQNFPRDPLEQPEYYCRVCDTPIDKDGICDSRACLKADML